MFFKFLKSSKYVKNIYIDTKSFYHPPKLNINIYPWSIKRQQLRLHCDMNNIDYNDGCADSSMSSTRPKKEPCDKAKVLGQYYFPFSHSNPASPAPESSSHVDTLLYSLFFSRFHFQGWAWHKIAFTSDSVYNPPLLRGGKKARWYFFSRN